MGSSTLHLQFLTLWARMLPEDAVRSLWYLSLLFIARHWVLAVANAGLTVLLGLWILQLLPRPNMVASTHRAGLMNRGRRAKLMAFFFEDLDLRLPRLLFIAALWKGAFYLILGDRHRLIHHPTYWFGCGLQFPNLRELLGLIPETSETIWRPTAETEKIGVLLAVVALALLLRRVKQMVSLLSWLNTLEHVCPPAMAAHAGEVGGKAEASLALKHSAMPQGGAAFGSRASTLEVMPGERLREQVLSALSQAAASLGISPAAPLPHLLLKEIPIATPLLVGVRRPYLLLAPSLVAVLSDEELAAMLRHELVHFRRRDHWWRWLLLWVEDIARPTLLSSWFSAQALEREEDICDRWAFSTPREAAALARAIAKTHTHSAAVFAPLSPLLLKSCGAANLDRALPQLLGHTRPNAAMIERRLQHLLHVAKRSAPAPETVRTDFSFAPLVTAVPEGSERPLRPPAAASQMQKAGREGHQIGSQEALALFALRLRLLLVAALVLIAIYAKFFFIICIG